MTKEYIVAITNDVIPDGFERFENEYSPECELIRCKDCKWWDQKGDSPWGYCHACKHGYWSNHWAISIYREYKGDWFCADAERKEDE